MTKEPRLGKRNATNASPVGENTVAFVESPSSAIAQRDEAARQRAQDSLKVRTGMSKKPE